MPSADFSLTLTDKLPGVEPLDSAVIGVFSEKEKFLPEGPLLEIERAAQGSLQILTEEKFTGALAKTLLLRNAAGVRRVVLVGLGEKQRLTARKLHRALCAGFEAAGSSENTKRIGLFLPDTGLDPVCVYYSAADAACDASYASLEARKPAAFASEVQFHPGAAGANPPLLREAMAAARAKSRAKDLTNMPPNLKRTTTLVERANSLAGIPGISLEITDDPAWIESHMPCFFTVALGSLATDPPRFIRVHYKPDSAKRRIALVGKSVIFDTGGYQVKTDDYMNTMKADMTGGAMVLSLIEAAARLELPLSISAYLAATPNMIDSRAMLPDSIVNTTCGKKVEIRHTDAEGRLTLIDAVAMAAREKPDALVTVATLTGSAARAVGEAVALMGNNEELRARLADAARKAGDPLQTLDIWDEDFDDIKSKLDGADIINTSQNKNRGAQSACAFVMSGLPEESIPMLHLDIAGADMTREEKATGIGVKALLAFLIEESRR